MDLEVSEHLSIFHLPYGPSPYSPIIFGTIKNVSALDKFLHANIALSLFNNCLLTVV